MQLELAQIPIQDGATDPNVQRVLDVIAKREAGTDLIVFPETTLAGFPTRDTVADVAQPLDGAALTRVRNAARAARVAVAVGLAERERALAELRLDRGLGDTLDVVAAENSLLDAQTALIGAELDRTVLALDLRRAVGTLTEGQWR